MQNLTQHLRVVGTERAGVEPQVGWHLVVFRQQGGGRIFEKHLQPSEKMKRGPLGFSFGSQSFVSIPVTSNGGMRHEFTSAIAHVSPGHFFEADYVLHFGIESHEKVAVRWSEDPVRRVEEEIRRVVNAIARVAPWEELRANILLDAGVAYFRDTVRDSAEDVQSFANDYGIHVDKLQMALRLSKIDAQPDEQEADLERSRRTIESSKQRQLAEGTANHEVKLQAAHHTAEIDEIKAFGALRASAPGHLDRAIGVIASNTTDAVGLVRNVKIIQSLSAHTGDAGLSAAQGSPPPYAQLGSASENKVAVAVEKLTATIDTLPGDRARKHELASALLHLVAEAWLGKDASPEAADKYTAIAKGLLSGWKDLNSDQYSTLDQFTEFRALQDRLK